MSAAERFARADPARAERHPQADTDVLAPSTPAGDSERRKRPGVMASRRCPADSARVDPPIRAPSRTQLAPAPETPPAVLPDRLSPGGRDPPAGWRRALPAQHPRHVTQNDGIVPRQARPAALRGHAQTGQNPGPARRAEHHRHVRHRPGVSPTHRPARAESARGRTHDPRAPSRTQLAPAPETPPAVLPDRLSPGGRDPPAGCRRARPAQVPAAILQSSGIRMSATRPARRRAPPKHLRHIPHSAASRSAPAKVQPG